MLYTTHALRHFRTVIGNNIRNTRTQRNILLSRLADQTGITAELLDRYELGRNEIDLNTLFKIACALDITPHDLIPKV